MVTAGGREASDDSWRRRRRRGLQVRGAQGRGQGPAASCTELAGHLVWFGIGEDGEGGANGGSTKQQRPAASMVEWKMAPRGSFKLRGKLATTGTDIIEPAKPPPAVNQVGARVVLPAVPPPTTPAVWELGPPKWLRKSHVHDHLEAFLRFFVEVIEGCVWTLSEG